MAIKKTKSGKIDRRYLTKAEKEELKHEADQEARLKALEAAQADNADGFVKEEGEPKPLYTNPERDFGTRPGLVTPVVPEGVEPDMSESRKQHGHIEYVERGDSADGLTDSIYTEQRDVATPDAVAPLPDGESGQR